MANYVTAETAFFIALNDFLRLNKGAQSSDFRGQSCTMVRDVVIVDDDGGEIN